MANPKIAALIESRLTGEGLTHPGDPDTNQPPTTIPLPGFRTTGMAAEQAKPVTAAAKLISEALVYLIEHDGDSIIIPTAELAQLKDADTRPGDAAPVTCSDCGQPAFYLAAKGERLTITKAGLGALARAGHVCKAVA